MQSDKLCESCGERQGRLNSSYLFDDPKSDPDCGDWVCYECEEQARIEHESGEAWPGCLYHEAME